MVWETGDRNYFSIFLSSRSLDFLFAVPNFVDGFMCLSHSEIKQEANVIASLMYLSCVALKWCMTSPLYVNRLFVSSRLFSGLDFV
jgi:hypothetical protein